MLTRCGAPARKIVGSIRASASRYSSFCQRSRLKAHNNRRACRVTRRENPPDCCTSEQFHATVRIFERTTAVGTDQKMRSNRPKRQAWKRKPQRKHRAGGRSSTLDFSFHGLPATTAADLPCSEIFGSRNAPRYRWPGYSTFEPTPPDEHMCVWYCEQARREGGGHIKH